MNTYYDQLLSQLQGNSKYIPPVQKTPEQLLDEMKQGKYIEYIQTKEGSEATEIYKESFNTWYNQKYNPNAINNSQEISELKAMVANLSNQIQNMNKPQNINNHNNK